MAEMANHVRTAWVCRGWCSTGQETWKPLKRDSQGGIGSGNDMRGRRRVADGGETPEAGTIRGSGMARMKSE